MDKCKWNWYQNNYEVFIQLLRLNVNPEKCSIILCGRELSVRNGENDIFTCNLYSDIEKEVDAEFSAKKAEIKLKKKTPGKWDDIRNKTLDPCPSEPRAVVARQWDRLAKEVDNDPECAGEEGVNKFFKQVYENLDEDGKKAMMKSMQESAGTVLSTDWKEVSKSKIGIKPPDGMEFKKY